MFFSYVDVYLIYDLLILIADETRICVDYNTGDIVRSFSSKSAGAVSKSFCLFGIGYGFTYSSLSLTLLLSMIVGSCS